MGGDFNIYENQPELCACVPYNISGGRFSPPYKAGLFFTTTPNSTVFSLLTQYSTIFPGITDKKCSIESAIKKKIKEKKQRKSFVAVVLNQNY